jgi:hypothetical protein
MESRRPLHLSPATQSLDVHAAQRLKESPAQKKLRSLTFQLNTLLRTYPDEKGTKTMKGKLIRKLEKKIRLAEEKKDKILQLDRRGTALIKIQSFARIRLAKIQLSELREECKKAIIQEEKEAKGRVGKEQAMIDASKRRLVAEKEKLGAKFAAKKAKREKQKLAKAAKKTAQLSSGGIKAVEAPLTGEEKRMKLLQIASSEKFRKQVYQGALDNNEFDQEQKDFIELIFLSNLPMFPQLTRCYTPQCYAFVILLSKAKTYLKEIKELLNKKISRNKVSSQKYLLVYNYIEIRLQNVYQDSNKPRPSLTYQDLIKLQMKMLHLIPKCIDEKNLWKPLHIVTPKENKAQRDVLLRWEDTLNNEVSRYRHDVKFAPKKIAVKGCITGKDCASLLQIFLPLPSLDAYHELVKALSLNPAAPLTKHLRAAIYTQDLAVGGLFDTLLKQNLIPKIIELNSIEAFTKIWLKEINLQVKKLTPLAAAVLDKIMSPNPYHHLLLDKLVTGKQDNPYYALLKQTVEEAYQNGAISPYSRVLPLHAVFASLRDTNEELMVCIDPVTNIYDAKKVHAFFRKKLESFDDQEFKPVLDHGGLEIITNTKKSLGYRGIVEAITQICATFRRGALSDLREHVVFMVRILAPLIPLADEMQKAQTKR